MHFGEIAKHENRIDKEETVLNKKFKVVLTDYNFPTLEIEQTILEGEGAELTAYHTQNDEELIRVAADADGLIDQFYPIGRKVIESLRTCKVIAVYGVGTNQIDLKAASEKGIKVVNIPDYCTDEVAGHAVSLLLGCARQVTNYDRLVKKGNWAYMGIKLYRLAGKTVGIVGLGSIGRSVAKKLSGFDLTLLGFDPYISEEVMASSGVKKVELDELLRSSDFVTLHIPLIAETTGLFSKERFRLMKPSAYFVNTSRGGLVDEPALNLALNDGWIAGAALDVLATEPPVHGHELLGHEKVVMTPHIAWYSEEAYRELRVKVAQSVGAVLNGREPISIVNRHLLK
jgi:D-3-phosphoglycerate dehydrogenase / 2-oxoglutarate reductase